MKNIALFGRARSGKSEVAKFLFEHHGYSIISFAEPVKIAVGRMLLTEMQTSPYPLGDDSCLKFVAQNKEAVRPILQAHAMTCRELFGDNFYVDKALEQIRANEAEGMPSVIDDLRFPNEANALRAAGFVLVFVWRPDWHREQHGGVTLSSEAQQHHSETAYRSIQGDFTITNMRDRDFLHSRVRLLLGAA